MPTILIAADADWLRDQLRRALVGPGQEVIETTRGQDVRPLVVEHEPDLVILDLQIGNMGGVAVAIDLNLEAAAGRAPSVPVLLLLDRECDRFLARRASAEAELVKPIDPGVVRRAVKGILGARDRLIGPDRPERTGRYTSTATGCGAVW